MISKKSILYFLIFSVAFTFVGCKKKPRRPNPLDTVIGDTSGTSGRSENIEDLTGPGTLAAGETPLFDRGLMDGERGERGIIAVMVYFDFDSSSIKASERAKLTQVADYLRTNPSHSLILEGHCDWRGTPEYNLALGERRSGSVNQYLATLGVPAERLETLSKGDLNAIEGASEAQMAEDRRVEFLVVR